MLRRALALPSTLVFFALACQAPEPAPAPTPSGPDPEVVAEVQTFVDGYTTRYLELYAVASEAEWAVNTHIVEGDDANRLAAEAAKKALAAFTGSVENIDRAQAFLDRAEALDPMSIRLLERILYIAANQPQTVAELVERRIAAEVAQTEALFGFDFQLDGRSVSTNEIDEMLIDETDLEKRLAVWETSKAVGPGLRDGLVELVDLRNRTVQALGYDDYFAYQVSDYGMSSDEMMALCAQLVADVWPLYRELHTWARYELAERYGAEVPDMLPAHWLPNRWGQEWNTLIDVSGLDLDAALAEQTPEWVVQQAEAFYQSLGFEPLPDVFWEKSDLYPLPADAGYKKNNHASAWHMDLDRDVRSLMSVEPNERWWSTTHHELGHIYYYLSYTRPEVPPLLREGANRAFHEAIGSQLGLASMQRPFLVGRGLADAEAEVDEIQLLLKEALDSVVFMPWAAGTMTSFEHDLYTGLAPTEYNARWWQHVEQFQGIVAPNERGEEYCDAATKTHINDDAAQYYDYALSYAILHQLHAHLAKEILHQDPRATDYWGNQEAGAFLAGILELGATKDWRALMRDELGEEISARAMLEYFAPLMEWLQAENEGRTYTLPAEPST